MYSLHPLPSALAGAAAAVLVILSPGAAGQTASAASVEITISPAVRGEAAKLRVVIQNLLSNAEKFTSEGHITLAAALDPSGRVAIRVSDTGPGIAPEHHEKIFDIFHQLRPHDGQTKGVGLGLALARRFARMMGGDISVESAVGKGTTFTVLLPVVAAPGTHREAAA